MNTPNVEQSVLSQWYELITEARKASLITLTEDTESYLVFLLMRFMNNPAIAGDLLSTEYLTGLANDHQIREALLQDVGDKCLLMSGLFPERAEKKRVRISYFVKLGQSAYTIVGQLAAKKGVATLYTNLSQDFVSMMDVLQTTRGLEENLCSQLTPIEAYELWFDTNSSYAFKVLQQYRDRQVY